MSVKHFFQKSNNKCKDNYPRKLIIHRCIHCNKCIKLDYSVFNNTWYLTFGYEDEYGIFRDVNNGDTTKGGAVSARLLSVAWRYRWDKEAFLNNQKEL